MRRRRFLEGLPSVAASLKLGEIEWFTPAGAAHDGRGMEPAVGTLNECQQDRSLSPMPT